MKNKFLILLVILFVFPFAAMAKGRQQVWVIDAGHGGRDVGCEGTKAKEKDINLKVALRVAQLVKQNLGVKVIMTRDTDKFLSLDERTRIANNAGADLFVSIHVNSAPEVSNIRGTETYYGPLDATSNADLEAARRLNIQKSELLAWEMQKFYGQAGRPISRGVKRERYYVILYTRMPSILTEIGFISTPSEQDYMTSAKGTEEIAQCIYRGLKEYKATVEAGNVKSALAEMRRTGGRSSGKISVSDKDLEKPAEGDAVEAADSSATDAKTAKGGKAADDKAASSGKDAAANGKSGKTAAAKDGKAATAKDGKSATVKDGKSATASGKSDGSDKEPELENGELTFSVQVSFGTTKLKPTDPIFKGLKGIKVVQQGNKYKYLYATSTDYAAVRKTVVEVRKMFPDAFIVAFIGDRQISTADALEMVRK